MKLARIAIALALAAAFATPLAAAENRSSLEAIRYDRSERSAPNWDRVEPRPAGQGSSQAPTAPAKR